MRPPVRPFPAWRCNATVLKKPLWPALSAGADWANAANAIIILASGLLLTFLCPAFGALAITLFAAVCLTLLVAGNVAVDIGPAEPVTGAAAV